MAHVFVSRKQLKGLLNDVECVHKKNIHEYASGHLNEIHLTQAASSYNRKSWSGAYPSQPSLVIPKQKSPRKSKQDDSMREALFQFSLGTSGSVPHPSPETKPPYSPTKRRPRFAFDKGSRSARSPYSEVADGILVEELHNQELMMPRLHSPNINLDVNVKHAGRVGFHHSFFPVQAFGITKQDKYENMLDFENNVLGVKDTAEKNVMMGRQAVIHHEMKLKQDLALYHLSNMGPNFHKLQVYSDIFEDLILDSPIFSYILGCIKVEYDNCIAKLLDGQTSQHHLLREQVQQMAAHGTSRPKDLLFIISKLNSLENTAKEELDKNSRLREELREETEWLANFPEQEPVQTSTMKIPDEPEPDLADEIEHVKALILEKLDTLNALRLEIKNNCVPLTVCTHLEQCIKETESEVQKLLKQNEYYERSIAEMDHDLKEAILDADTSEKDAKRIWRKVNSNRGLPGASGTSAEQESDDDDEENKWNWYIS